MRKVRFSDSLRIIGRGSRNWVAGRPIVVSFEVTDSCSCYCKHCDHGGPRNESRQLQPAGMYIYKGEYPLFEGGRGQHIAYYFRGKLGAASANNRYFWH